MGEYFYVPVEPNGQVNCLAVSVSYFKSRDLPCVHVHVFPCEDQGETKVLHKDDGEWLMVEPMAKRDRERLAVLKDQAQSEILTGGGKMGEFVHKFASKKGYKLGGS